MQTYILIKDRRAQHHCAEREERRRESRDTNKHSPAAYQQHTVVIQIDGGGVVVYVRSYSSDLCCFAYKRTFTPVKRRTSLNFSLWEERWLFYRLVSWRVFCASSFCCCCCILPSCVDFTLRRETSRDIVCTPLRHMLHTEYSNYPQVSSILPASETKFSVQTFPLNRRGN
jgi:hypothetical protein